MLFHERSAEWLIGSTFGAGENTAQTVAAEPGLAGK
jgi:hypothetical protein